MLNEKEVYDKVFREAYTLKRKKFLTEKAKEDADRKSKSNGFIADIIEMFWKEKK